MSSPPAIPDHTLRRPIGKGSYGEVWLARNVMGTPRAVKIVWRRQFDSERPYEREFAGIQGYEPVSRTADGLVHVLHVGRNDAEGYFYYVMELADSVVPMADDSTEVGIDTPHRPTDLTPLLGYTPRTLRSDMKRLGRLPVADCIRLALDVVGGLTRLHDRGLVHRDVKPGNIIFVDGRAKLADIGLVSRESEGRTFVGTEGYIPPEGPGSPSADLYALGMVLYEAITGYAPEHFPRVPTEWFTQEGSSEALEFHAVVLKACEGSKERRYKNADELQADLALLQSGQSVRHLRALEDRVNRWRKIGTIAAITVVIAVGVALTANWRARVAADSQAREARLLEQTRAALARAESAEHATQQQLYSALLEQARATIRSGEMGQRVRALDAIRRASAITNSTDLRREAVAALALPDLRFERHLDCGVEPSLLQLDPVFERIAVSRAKGPVEIRAVSDNRLLAELPASTNLICYSALWSDDGRFIALNRDYDTTGYRSDLEVWDLRREPRRILLIKEARWKARTFHPHKPRFVAALADGYIAAWNLETGEEIGREKFDAWPQELSHSPDGRRTAAAYQRTDGWGVSVHDAGNGTMICSNVFKNQIKAFAWSPNGRSLALAEESGAIYLMDALTGQARVLGRHKAVAVNTTFNQDGRYLITGAWGRELICWDILRNQRAFTIDVESFYGQFRADGGACAFLNAAGIQIYTFERPAAHVELAEEMSPQTRHAAFSPNGRWLGASSEERMGIWDLEKKGPGAFAEYAADSRVFWATDNEIFGSSSRHVTCFHWRVHAATNSEGPPILERIDLRRPSKFVSISAHSNSVVWTSAKGSQIRERGDEEADEQGWLPTMQGVNGVSSDGKWLAIYGPFTRYVAIYRLPGLEYVATLTNRARVSGFSFSPSCDELAVASNGQVEFWSTTTWQHTRVATNFTGLPGIGALFQPDGQNMWLARNLRNAGLFRLPDFTLQLSFPAGLVPLAVTADGRRIAASLEGRRLQIWDMVQLRHELRQLGLDW